MTDNDVHVTRHECNLRHMAVETRFGSLEGDMAEVKKDVAEIRGELVNMRKESVSFYADARTALVWILRITAIALVLIAAGRGMDISWIIGGLL